jgi:hypothetical protein
MSRQRFRELWLLRRGSTGVFRGWWVLGPGPTRPLYLAPDRPIEDDHLPTRPIKETLSCGVSEKEPVTRKIMYQRREIGTVYDLTPRFCSGIC